MEPVAVNVPLPCYGYELDVRDPQCIQCPHLLGCQMTYGLRRNRIPMSQVRFKLLPDSLRRPTVGIQEDPEFVYINDLYAQCHLLVFDQKFKESESLRKHAPEIARSAQELHCSIRLYMLACMLGFKRHHLDTLGAVRADSKEFRVSHLLGEGAKARVRNYVELCRQQFGTFTLEAIDLLARPAHDTTELDQGMRRSEITAARFLVQHKQQNRFAPEPIFYARYEFELDSHWLAIEPSYYEVVLKPYLDLNCKAVRKVSHALQRHRHAVIQQIGLFKQKPNHARAIHLSRSSMMRPVLGQVLSEYNLGMEDLESQVHEVTDAFEFWSELGRAVAQLNCLRMYYGPDLSKTYFD